MNRINNCMINHVLLTRCALLKQPQNDKLVISIRSQSGKAGFVAAVMVPFNITVCKRPIKHCP
jgi:hypothetical protein